MLFNCKAINSFFEYLLFGILRAKILNYLFIYIKNRNLIFI